MLGRLRQLKRLFTDLPRYVKLTYCLLADDRVPLTRKAMMLGAMALIVTPAVDVPMWVPVLGEMDVVALFLLAARLFVATAPREVVIEHEEAIRRGRSRFDVDVEHGRDLASALSRRLHGEDAAPAEHDLTGHAAPDHMQTSSAASTDGVIM